MACQYTFHSLKPYNELPAKYSPLPFRDRPLTEIEEWERLEWWKEAEPVTMEGNFLERISVALSKDEGERSAMDRLIVAEFMKLKQHVEAVEGTTKHEGEE